MKRGISDTLPTHLPARYRRGVLWNLDKRSEIAREVSADLVELSQDLGGWDSLSTQQRILCERIVFMRRRALEFESAVMAGRQPPYEYGPYSNICNVLAGYLKALGLKRQARPVETLHEYMARVEAEEAQAYAVPPEPDADVSEPESDREATSDSGGAEAAGEQSAAPEPSNEATEGAL